MSKQSNKIHPEGENQKTKIAQSLAKVAVDTYGGRVHIEWDHDAPITPMGQLAFFIEFLKHTELFQSWVQACPLELLSPNAPTVCDVLGTILLSVLSGHTRYSHMTTVRTDKVNPSLLGMKKIVSEDSVRRNLKKIDAEKGADWLVSQLKKTYEEILNFPWVLDVDTTVKCLYGHQEGALVGYNPKKPGRPSHTYHTYMISNIRMILNTEVMAGNESASSHTLPHLFSWLDELPKAQLPAFIRGDSAFGTDAVMNACETRGQKYLFKLKQTSNVKRLISQQMTHSNWRSAGQGWEGCASQIQLSGWKHPRDIVVLRRKIKKDIGVVTKDSLTGQSSFQFADVGEDIKAYEYAVLVTNMETDVLMIASHYRDRADCENNFDELKNQWGWCGFTTQDLHRCRLMAKITALIYNWWTLFVRLIEPNRHIEAITSRPLLLHAVGKKIQHAGQKIIQVNSNHAHFEPVQNALIELSAFFKSLRCAARQLSQKEKMKRVIYRAFKFFIDSVKKSPPNILPQPG